MSTLSVEFPTVKMSLSKELSSFYDEFSKSAPKEAVSVIDDTISHFKKTYDPAKAIQPGNVFPEFELSDANGQKVSSKDILRKGAFLVSFYRGEWCPCCNIELRALQAHLEDFREKGVTLVAVSPELPDQSLSTSEKLSLKFPVLSDVDSKLARQLGISVIQPAAMQSVFDTFGVDWKKRNGTGALEVPVPATFLVDSKGIVRNTFVNPKYQYRLDPETALGWVDRL